MNLRIRLENGWEKEIRLTQPLTSFGTHAGCDVPLAGPDILPLHFQIKNQGGRFSLIPFSDRLSVTRSGKALPFAPRREIPLCPGDTLQVDNTQLYLEAEKAAVGRRFSLPAVIPAILLLVGGAIWAFFLRNYRSPNGTPVSTLISATAVPSFSKTVPSTATVAATRRPVSLRLDSEETGPNTYLLKWEVDAHADARVRLVIGSETQSLDPARFRSEQTLRLTADTEIELTAEDGTVEKSERLRLNYRKRDPRIAKFIVWLQNTEGMASEKVAELFPDRRIEDAYRVQEYRNTALPAGARLLIEWDVRDADSVTISPLSDSLLPHTGAFSYLPTQSVNFNLTAFSDGTRIDASIPIRMGATAGGSSGSGVQSAQSPQRTPATARMKIDFFSANPAVLDQSGETTVAWSVSGPYTQIRIIDQEQRLLAFDLPAAGLRRLPIAENTTLMLQVENGSETAAKTETVRIRANGDDALRTATLSLRTIFPDLPSYTAGDRIQVGVAFQDIPVNQSPPTGSILISDGVSSCVMTLPRETCEILLRADGERDFSIRYSGDRTYLPTAADFNLTVLPFERKPVRLTLSTYRGQTVFTPGEKIRLQAEIRPVDATGTLFFSDGARNCLTTLPKNTCELAAPDPGSAAVSVQYSGDSAYLDARQEITLISSPIEPSATAPLIRTALSIRQLFPEKSEYTVGDTVDVTVSLTNDAGREGAYRNRVRVSDGVSECTFLPNTTNHCSLRFTRAQLGELTASYGGDETFSSAISAPLPITVRAGSALTETPEAPVKIATALAITRLYPDRSVYTVGDTIDVYISLTNAAGIDDSIARRIRISDGISDCTVQPNTANHCSLRLMAAGEGRMTAAFPGDDRFLPSSADREISVRPAAKIQTQTQILAIDPAKDAYELNETVFVSVSVRPHDSSGGKSPSGTVSLHVGNQRCELMVPAQSGCTLTLSDPNATEMIAVYSGDDDFEPSESTPRPIRLRVMEMTLELLAESYGDGCDQGIADLSLPVPMRPIQNGETVTQGFILDERFQIGRGFYVDAAVEHPAGLFSAPWGTFSARLCSSIVPDQCVDTADVSAFPDGTGENRLAARLKIPALKLAGRCELTVTFTASDPALGRIRTRAEVDAIQLGNLILVPAEGVIDWPGNRVRWDDRIPAPDRDQTFRFNLFLVRDRLNRCAVPLDESFPAPSFQTIDVSVSEGVPGAAGPDAAWQAAIRDQGVPENDLRRMQPNLMNWYGDRCHAGIADGSWRIDCQQVGLTEPSWLTFSGGIDDPNYQASAEAEFPIDVGLKKYAVTIIPSAGWNALAPGEVYWLNAAGADFNVWAGRDCADPATRGYQTSNTRIPENRRLTVRAKLLSRARSTELELAGAEGALSLERGSGTAWEYLSTYQGVCGSCTPKVMMDFDWIVNEGCAEEGGAVRIFQPDGKLFGGQLCENNEYKQIGTRSDFCQLRFGQVGTIHFRLEESETQLEARTEFVPGRGRGTAVEAGAGLTDFDRTGWTETEIAPFRPEIALIGVQGQIAELRVGEVARFRIGLARPIASSETVRVELPAIVQREALDLATSSCVGWFNEDGTAWIIPGSAFIPEADLAGGFAAECSLTFRQSSETRERPIFRVVTPDQEAFEWTGFPGAIGKRTVSLTPSLRLVLAGDDGAPDRGALNNGRVERLYPDDELSESGREPLARYWLRVLIGDERGDAVSLLPGEAVRVESSFFAALERVGGLDLCWTQTDGSAFEISDSGLSCGFIIPPAGLTNADLGSVQVSLRSFRFEGSASFAISGTALDPETVSIGVRLPERRVAGEPSQITFIRTAELSGYARAWLARHSAGLIQLDGEPGSAGTCAQGMNFDESGTASCEVWDGMPDAEAEPLSLRLNAAMESEAIRLSFVNADTGESLTTLALPRVEAAALSLEIGAAGLGDPISVGADALFTFRVSQVPFRIATDEGLDKIVWIDAPGFQAPDAEGTCSDLDGIPWTASGEGAWEKSCGVRWTSVRALTDVEREIRMTLQDVRFISADGAAVFHLPAEVAKRTVMLSSDGVIPAVRFSGEPLRWRIYIESEGIPVLSGSLKATANGTFPFDCEAEAEPGWAECVLNEAIPGDSVQLRAEFSGGELYSDAAIESPPIPQRRYPLSAEKTFEEIDNLAPYMIILPDLPPEDSVPVLAENGRAFLDRAFFDAPQIWDASLLPAADLSESCAAAPDEGLVLEAILETRAGEQRLSFPCVGTAVFADGITCESDWASAAEFDPKMVRSLSSLTLRFAGDECFAPFELAYLDEPLLVADIVTSETSLTADGFELAIDPIADWESLTVYCDQPDMPMRCRVDGAESDCWGLAAPLPLANSTLKIEADEAVAPDCRWLGTDRSGRTFLGVP